ncbi:MAG: hypothetical protein ACI9LX_001532 [Paraglaciecola sp.]|jgi:hypothetical protein
MGVREPWIHFFGLFFSEMIDDTALCVVTQI